MANLADLMAAKQGYKRLRGELLEAGQVAPDQMESFEHQEASLDTIEDRIRNAIEELPEEIRREFQEKERSLRRELDAQERAARLNLEFRPRLQKAFRLIEGVVQKASEEGLVVLRETSDLRLPLRTIYSTSFLQSEGVELEDKSTGITFHFSGQAMWRVYLSFGRVKSPGTIWHEKTDVWYPMIRIQEIIGERETVLATVYFEPETKELTINPNDRPSVLSGKFALLIWDGFSLTVRRATQEGRASFKVAQQSCRRKDAQSSGGNFPDSALVLKNESPRSKRR